MSKKLFNKVIHLHDNMSDNTSVLNTHIINCYDVDYHDHSFYEICYVIDGPLAHYANEQRMDLIAGDIVFLRPKDRHAYVRDNNCMTHHRDIIFQSDFFESVLKSLHPSLLEDYHKSPLPFKTNLSISTIENFEKKISEYSLLANDDTKSRIIFAKILLTELLYYYTKPLFQKENVYPPLVNQIIQKLNMRHILQSGTKYIFSNFNYSKSYICKTFKKHMHVSLTEYINELRLEYATVLLKTTNFPLYDITYECGFSSLAYFNNLFKKRFNCSPAKYRNSKTV